MLPDYSKVSFPNMKPLPLSLVLPQAHPDDLHFLAHLLVLDPARRMSAQDALCLPYFNSANPLPSAASALRVPRRVKPQATGACISHMGQTGKSKLVDSVESFLAIVDDLLRSEDSSFWFLLCVIIRYILFSRTIRNVKFHSKLYLYAEFLEMWY